MALRLMFLPGADSHLLPICPRPSVWWKVETMVPSAVLLFDKSSNAQALVEATWVKSMMACPTNKVLGFLKRK